MPTRRLLLCASFCAVLAVVVPAQTVSFTVNTIDSNPNKTGNDSLEKTVDFFGSTTVPSYILGQGVVNGSPGGMFLYQAADGVHGPFTRTVVANNGSFYEGAKAFKFPGDVYPGLIASVDRKLVWFQNPKNWGGNISVPWPSFVINPAAGCHDLHIVDVDGDGKQDVVCSGSTMLASQSFVAFQNAYNSWAIRSNVAPAGDAVGMLSINGSPSYNIVGCQGANLYWYENPKLNNSAGNPRTALWPAHYIGGCDVGNALGVGSFNGHDSVIMASNENDWLPGLVWYDPGTTPYSTWAAKQLDSTYRAVHSVTTGTTNGHPYFTLGEQEQACLTWSGNPPMHAASLGCRVTVYVYATGGFTPTILSKGGTQNQATVPFAGGFLMVGANHHFFGLADPAMYDWLVTIGAPSGGGFQAGNYAMNSLGAGAYTVDGGFYRWNGTTAVQEYTPYPANSFQQWKFAAVGSNFSICNVGDTSFKGTPVCMSDEAGAVNVAVRATDTWTVAASGSGYTVRNARTGAYINDPAGMLGNVRTSATATVWSVRPPL